MHILDRDSLSQISGGFCHDGECYLAIQGIPTYEYIVLDHTLQSWHDGDVTKEQMDAILFFTGASNYLQLYMWNLEFEVTGDHQLIGSP